MFTDPLAIELGGSDFLQGSLQRISYARPGKLFTANANLIVREVGRLTPAALDKIRQQIVKLLRGPSGS